MQVTINGRRWHLRFVENLKESSGALGECDPPTATRKQIRIDDSLRGELLLDTLLHEIEHAKAWHVDEDHVAEAATETARILYRVRLQYPEKLEI